ncbi:hypothetical protein GCM10029963_14580 [Micromonospora andamanensis]
MVERAGGEAGGGGEAGDAQDALTQGGVHGGSFAFGGVVRPACTGGGGWTVRGQVPAELVGDPGPVGREKGPGSVPGVSARRGDAWGGATSRAGTMCND